jgi:hypothetical protein
MKEKYGRYIDGRTTVLTTHTKEYDLNVWIGLFWLRIGTGGDNFREANDHSGCIYRITRPYYFLKIESVRWS